MWMKPKSWRVPRQLFQPGAHLQPFLLHLLILAPAVKVIPFFLPGQELFAGFGFAGSFPGGVLRREAVSQPDQLSKGAEEGGVPAVAARCLTGQQVHDIADPQVFGELVSFV